MLPAEATEVVPMNRKGLARLEGCDSRRAWRAGIDQRELAERLAGSVHGDGRAVSELCGHADGEAARADQMERVRRIASVEDDLAAIEPAPPSDSEEAAELRLRQASEELPLRHGRSVTDVTRRM